MRNPGYGGESVPNQLGKALASLPFRRLLIRRPDLFSIKVDQLPESKITIFQLSGLDSMTPRYSQGATSFTSNVRRLPGKVRDRSNHHLLTFTIAHSSLPNSAIATTGAGRGHHFYERGGLEIKVFVGPTVSSISEDRGRTVLWHMPTSTESERASARLVGLRIEV